MKRCIILIFCLLLFLEEHAFAQRSGPGLFQGTSTCSDVTGQVANQTYCFDYSTGALNVWNGSQWVQISGSLASTATTWTNALTISGDYGTAILFNWNSGNSCSGGGNSQISFGTPLAAYVWAGKAVTPDCEIDIGQGSDWDANLGNVATATAASVINQRDSNVFIGLTANLAVGQTGWDYNWVADFGDQGLNFYTYGDSAFNITTSGSFNVDMSNAVQNINDVWAINAWSGAQFNAPYQMWIGNGSTGGNAAAGVVVTNAGQDAGGRLMMTGTNWTANPAYYPNTMVLDNSLPPAPGFGTAGIDLVDYGGNNIGLWVGGNWQLELNDTGNDVTHVNNLLTPDYPQAVNGWISSGSRDSYGEGILNAGQACMTLNFSRPFKGNSVCTLTDDGQPNLWTNNWKGQWSNTMCCYHQDGTMCTEGGQYVVWHCNGLAG